MFEPVSQPTPPGTQSELVTLTLTLAYECARTDIELACRQERADLDGSMWHHTEEVDEEDRARVDRAVRYLELRQLLTRRVGQESVIQILPAPASYQYPRPS